VARRRCTVKVVLTALHGLARFDPDHHPHALSHPLQEVGQRSEDTPPSFRATAWKASSVSENRPGLCSQRGRVRRLGGGTTSSAILPSRSRRGCLVLGVQLEPGDSAGHDCGEHVIEIWAPFGHRPRGARELLEAGTPRGAGLSIDRGAEI
jgi:hypothetical protein